uniref:Uncharacterized protein n=1 Tax=Nicotiana tabacum TaxID=4097 RepID=A0A1S3ZI19_TOBAC|nr:PREDICTED: uncharacterized protein LOC107787090 [Nicotiana tabacum]
MGKTIEEALQLLNEISENVIQWLSERVIIKKTATVNQVDALNTLTQQIVSLAQKFESFQANTKQSSQSEACDMCGGNHLNHECQAINQNDKHINVIGYKQHPFGSLMAHKHPGFQWSNPNSVENSQSFQKPQQMPQQIHPSHDGLLYKYIKVADKKMESQNSALKNLEIQLSQLATLMSEKIQGPLPSNTEKNPKEHPKVITLRSGKELDEPNKVREEKNQSEQQVNKGKNVETPSKPLEDKEVKKKEEKNIEKMIPPPVTIHFPQKMKREKLDGEFAKFLEILKQIHINIPFTDALMQMSSYAKILKEILSSKKKLEEIFVVTLTEKCSAILQNKLLQKFGDIGSFTIPCTLGGVYFEKALCDSGASINLMPLSIFRKLDLGEMKDISVSLQFADQSTKKPKRIIENVFIRVDKFVFPIDFIVLEMKECPDEPIILGRLFLATDEYRDDQLTPDPMERCLAKSGIIQDDDSIIRKEAEILEKDSEDQEMQREEVQPKIELKILPSHLKYAYLEKEQCPVIISSSLTQNKKND